ncbi:MAG: hypothetical protein IAE85_04890 [Anaerolinea sp.]|nr:hypothetical protein [Anaerolinea sp.]
MWEQFMAWLRSLFGQPDTANALEKLNAANLREKVILLDAEKEKVISRTEKLEADRERLRLEARKQDDLRKREIAKQIVSLDEEISDKKEQLDQIYQQRKMIRQLIRYSERVDRMRQYGLEKIFGPKVNLADLDRQIQAATMGGSLDMERLTQVTGMIDSALAYGRATTTDDDVLRVLNEIAGDEEIENMIDDHLMAQPSRPVVEDPAVRRALAEIEGEDGAPQPTAAAVHAIDDVPAPVEQEAPVAAKAPSMAVEWINDVPAPVEQEAPVAAEAPQVAVEWIDEAPASVKQDAPVAAKAPPAGVHSIDDAPPAPMAAPRRAVEPPPQREVE